MSEAKFNMSRIYPDIKSESGQSRLTFGVYGGNLSIAIWGQAGGKPKANVNVHPDLRIMLAETLIEIQKAAPGAKMPIVIKEYDKNGNPPGMKIKTVVSIGKSDNGVVYIEVAPTGDAPEKFPLRGSKNFEMSSAENNDQTRSKRSTTALINFIRNEWAHAAMLSRYGVQDQRRNGGGNYQKPNTSSGSESSYSSNSSSNTDDGGDIY